MVTHSLAHSSLSLKDTQPLLLSAEPSALVAVHGLVTEVLGASGKSNIVATLKRVEKYCT